MVWSTNLEIYVHEKKSGGGGWNKKPEVSFWQMPFVKEENITSGQKELPP